MPRFITCKSIVVSALLILPASGHAAMITSLIDNFDAEEAQLNYSSFANWSVEAGFVDTIANGQFGINCPGVCIDLDGSGGEAGVLSTIDTFAHGVYRVSFELSGNQRTTSADDELTVTFGDLAETIAIVDPSAPFMNFTFTATVEADGEFFSFSHAGGDNVGLILDNVSITLVPVPGAILFFASALGSMFLRPVATTLLRRRGISGV